MQESTHAQSLQACVGVKVEMTGDARRVAGVGPEIACSTSTYLPRRASSAPVCRATSTASWRPSVVRGHRWDAGRLLRIASTGSQCCRPVSLPIENPTRPAAVAAPGPALDPEDPSSSSHGFIVWPPNQMSLSASAPRLSFATRTAPAASAASRPRHLRPELDRGTAPHRRSSECRQCRADPFHPTGFHAEGHDIFPARSLVSLFRLPHCHVARDRDRHSAAWD